MIHFHLNYGLGLHMSLIGNHQDFSVREFSPAGVKVFKMMLNSADGWLDPSTVKLFMNIETIALPILHRVLLGRGACSPD